MRSELAGPIKNVRDQLMMVRNVLDDLSGHDAGAQLDTQAVMQVMATQSPRTDVFEQLQPMYKDEAWVILIDASKSISILRPGDQGDRDLPGGGRDEADEAADPVGDAVVQQLDPGDKGL